MVQRIIDGGRTAVNNACYIVALIGALTLPDRRFDGRFLRGLILEMVNFA